MTRYMTNDLSAIRQTVADLYSGRVFRFCHRAADYASEHQRQINFADAPLIPMPSFWPLNF